MQLLGLKDHFQEHKERDGFCKCCRVREDFIRRLLGSRGRSVRRKWREWRGGLSTFFSGSSSDCGEKKPSRLAYLLHGEAAFVGSDSV